MLRELAPVPPQALGLHARAALLVLDSYKLVSQATEEWLAVEFDSDVDLLQRILSDDLEGTHVGRYLAIGTTGMLAMEPVLKASRDLWQLRMLTR